MVIRFIVFILFFLSIHATTTYADDFKAGIKALANNDHKTAIKLWTPLANKGHSDTQYKLGVLYHSFANPEPDKTDPDWLSKQMADRMKNWKIFTDYSNKSTDNLLKAAEQGNKKASDFLLYNCYAGSLLGSSERLNNKSLPSRIRKFYSTLADRKDPRAAYQVSNIYVHDKNWPKVIEWLRKSAELGYELAYKDLGDRLMNTDSPELNKEGIYWFKKAASLGNESAMYSLGMNYWIGQGVAVNHQKGTEYIKSAADKNEASALFYMSIAKYYGLGTNKDLYEAATYFRDAMNAKYHLGWHNTGAQASINDLNAGMNTYNKKPLKEHERNYALLMKDTLPAIEWLTNEVKRRAALYR